MKTLFHYEPVYNEKYLKAKTKCYEPKASTNFHNDKLTKEGLQYICLSVTLNYSVCRSGKSYYLHLILEEYKYIVKEKKMLKYITSDFEISSDGENSDE